MFTLHSSSLTASVARFAAMCASSAALACNDGSARPVTLDLEAPLHWTRDTIVLELSPERPGGAVPPWVRAALTRAARVWNDALDGCGAPRLAVADAARVRARVVEDRVNEVVLLERAWCPPDTPERQNCYDPTRHASTHLRARKNPGEPRRGVIEEADVVVNGVDFGWSARGHEPGTLSLEASFAHELGHVLGLDHPEEPALNAIMQPTAAESLADKRLEPLRAEVDTVCRSHDPRP